MTDPPPAPVRRATGDPADPVPLVELKQHLVFYLHTPPGPKTARAVYDLYAARFGGHVRHYRSTAAGRLPRDWTPAARHQFETTELPRLRAANDWGYRFWDGRPTDSWQFLFHGYPPVSEPDAASLVRCQFPHDLAPPVLLEFARAVAAVLPCLWATGGFCFEGRPLSNRANRSFDAMFGLAHRYWGAEAQNLDVTAERARQGFTNVNWLTLVGTLGHTDPDAVGRARAAAFAAFDTPGGVLLQAEDHPRLIDRNRQESLGNYPAVAEALLPLQLAEHEPFGGDVWDEDDTMTYLRRFTHPDEV